MAITAPGFWYAGDLNGNYSAAIREYTVTDTTAIAAGDAVIMASGKVTLGTANAKLAGVAQGAALVTESGKKIKVALFTPTAVFKAQSDGTDFTTAMLFTAFDIIATTGGQGIDVSDTTQGKQQMLLIGIDPNDPTFGYFICQETQLSGAALVA